MTSLERMAWLGLAVCLPLTAGCSRSDALERFAVAGQVQVDGLPLANGTIRFLPAQGTTGPAAVGVITDGRYEISRNDGPVAGRYRVEIEQQLDLSFAIDDEAAYAQAYASTRGRPIPAQPIPAKYNRRSELTADVSADKSLNAFDYNLQASSSSPRR